MLKEKNGFDALLSKALKETLPEPNWPRFEAEVMQAIVSGTRKSKTRPRLTTLSGVLLCIGVWITLVTGIWEQVPTTSKIEPRQPYLSVQEQRIIQEFPEIKQLLNESRPRYVNGDLEEYLMKRYPELKGVF